MDNVKPSPLPEDLEKRLRGVYKKILAELWPLRWVKSSRLLDLTGQKYFDRRIRELRDEFGFDIESKHQEGEWSYRLKSHTPRFPKRRRKYPTPKDRKALVERDGSRCNICGFKPPNERISGFLQYDHRVPFNERQGSTTLENLQLLCSRCNVIKRRACQVCTLKTCENCAYAYPEKFGSVHLIALSKEARTKYRDIARKKGVKVEDVIKQIIEEHEERL